MDSVVEYFADFGVIASGLFMLYFIAHMAFGRDVIRNHPVRAHAAQVLVLGIALLCWLYKLEII